MIADEPLDYPVTQEVDVLVALTQEAARRHAAAVRPGGAVVADAGRVEEIPPGSYAVRRLPIYRAVPEALGTEALSNVAALGGAGGVGAAGERGGAG
ncbi:MAG: 2-oxoacid:acceptor oxidoreductase family protein [Armatimonadota bacterium]|nr:2-oxoacid:acceptor oxidoreductase family protein [Armatimonadota bacterium]MDW8155109.1 2-oxoacid:acceptor oxidoreductase family protein [Armatimonadota bacterium]